ncbi:PaaI family thioesterase [Streptomyces anulatus]
MTTADPTTMTGLELMRWVQTELPTDIPSIGSLLGMRFDEVDHGRIVISLDTRPDFANPLGTVHGGIAATLLDSVMGCAVHTTLPAGAGYTTLELKVNYIRTARTGRNSSPRERSSTPAAASRQPRARCSTSRASSSPTPPRPA